MNRYGRGNWNKELEVIRERGSQADNTDDRDIDEERLNFENRYRRSDSDLVIKIIIGIVLGGGILFVLEVTAGKLYDNPYGEFQKVINAELQTTSQTINTSMRKLANIQNGRELNRQREMARIDEEKASELERVRLSQKLK